MITIQHIHKSFGAFSAVRDVSFVAKDQEVLVLLGTSGSGKTTTLKMINRLLEPTHGDIFIDGKNIADFPVENLRRNIGYVLQHHGLFPHFTVEQNIAIVPSLLGRDKGKIKSRVHELMSKLHLPDDLRTAYPQQLSGGQQQRVGLARALAGDPPILLMDEPFGALDSITRAKVHHEIIELDELKKKTVIMVTHDIQEAFLLGDHICLMDQGRIVQDGRPEELLFSPENSFVAAFLQKQRLQLEFKAYSLASIWTLLPNESIKSARTDQVDAGKDNILTPKSTIWEAMEQLTLGNVKNIAIKDADTGEIKVIDFSALLTGFYTHTSKGRHE